MATGSEKWAIVQVQLPESITAVAQVLDSLIGALLAVLEVIRAVLDVVKVFLIGLLDPLAVILAAAIAEIEALISDIRQIGVYVSGDLDVTYPYSDLLGGFQAYERRMVARLVDRTDPTRPAFSSRSAVIAVFLYASFDTSSVAEMLLFISKVKAFFGLYGKPRPFTTPVGLSVAYGSSAASTGSFSTAMQVLQGGAEPTKAVVRWQMAPPPGAGAVGWPLPGPPGFLVEVSTVPDGLTLAYMQPGPRAAKDAEGEQHQTWGLVFDPDGQPFRLYGGLDVLNVGDMEWSGSGGTYTPPTGDGKTRLFAYQGSADSCPIPPNALLVNGEPVLQRAFYVEQGTPGFFVSPGQQYACVLNYDEMPYGATFEDVGGGVVQVTVDSERAREVYVRVSGVTAEGFQWGTQQSLIEGGASKGKVQLVVPGSFSAGDKGDPSAPLKVTFPSTQTAAYIETVATAMAVMILARADLVAQGSPSSSNPPLYQPGTAGEATGLEDIARYLVPEVVGHNVSKFLSKPYADIRTFRGRLLVKCRAAASYLLERTGPLPSSVESYILDESQVVTAAGVSKPLRNVTWADLAPDIGSDATLLGSLDPTSEAGLALASGVAPTPETIGNLDPTFVGRHYIGAVSPLTRAPGFLVESEYVLENGVAGQYAGMGTGSEDYSPVLYAGVGGVPTIRFCRNVFHANPSVLAASAKVLNVAAAPLGYARRPGEGAWVNYRLFPAGIPPVDLALARILAFLRAVQDGVTGVADAILAFIEFLEARILELEALLRRIQGLLDLVLAISVPPAAGLVVTAEGTDGVLQALVAADNKPSDSALAVNRVNAQGKVEVTGGTYGAGVVLVAGGLPASLLDLVKLLFVKEE